MYKIYLTLYVITSFLISQYNISGFIYDSETGESLPGANIFLKNTSYGTTSDLDGYFIILNVPAESYSSTAKVLSASIEAIFAKSTLAVISKVTLAVPTGKFIGYPIFKTFIDDELTCNL